jgi:hypothetical protein
MKGLFLSLALWLPFHAIGAGLPPEPTEAEIREADSSFKYKGKWIHPGLVKQFEGWVSDSGAPITVAVDVAAAHGTNQYADEVKIEGGLPTVTLKSEGTEANEYYGYRWLGRLKGGSHLVEFFSAGGGGTLVSTTLFFFKLSEGKGVRPSHDGRLKESKAPFDKPYRRLVLSIERYHIIGDRVSAEYKLKDHSVTVSFGSTKKTLTE